MEEKSLQPTRKWWVSQTTAMAALLIAWVNVGAWDKTVTVGIIGFATQAITSYLTPNHELPGGVKVRKSPSEKKRLGGKYVGRSVLPAQRGAMEDAAA
jgi:hypothetical protein